MRASKHLRACLWFVLTAVPACSSNNTDPVAPDASTSDPDSATSSPDGGSPDAPDPDTTGDGNSAEACDDYARSDCDYMTRCTPFSVDWLFGSYAACLVQVKEACAVLSTAPGTSWTPPALLTCMKASEGLACDDFSTVPACEIQPGAKENGAPCVTSAQCTSTYCWRNLGDDCGVCGEKGAIGAACSRDANCQSGLCTQSLCAPYLKEGDACQRLEDCPYELFCSDGTCKKPTHVPLGQPCDGELIQCEGDLTCDNGACDKATLVEVGERCGFLANGKYAFCRASDCGSAGVCQKAVPVGGACPSRSVTCADGALCTKGICKAYTPDACETPRPSSAIDDSRERAHDARIAPHTRRPSRIIGE